MNQELLPTLIEIISDLRDKRKVGNQTDAEFELEGAIAEYFRQERVYELYLDKINGIRSDSNGY